MLFKYPLATQGIVDEQGLDKTPEYAKQKGC